MKQLEAQAPPQQVPPPACGPGLLVGASSFWWPLEHDDWQVTMEGQGRKRLGRERAPQVLKVQELPRVPTQNRNPEPKPKTRTRNGNQQFVISIPRVGAKWQCTSSIRSKGSDPKLGRMHKTQQMKNREKTLFSVNLKFRFFCLFFFKQKSMLKKEEERPEPQAANRKHSPPQASALPSPDLVSWGGWQIDWTGVKWLYHLVRVESLSCPFCLCSSVGCVLGWICLQDWIVTKLGCYFSQPAERRCC